jgi:hypothetical protein
MTDQQKRDSIRLNRNEPWADRLSESATFYYQTTTDERSALEWIGSRYAVSAVILDALDDDGVIDLGWAGAGLDIRDALARDGIDRVPCLSERTDLAYLVWLLGPSDGAE